MFNTEVVEISKLLLNVNIYSNIQFKLHNYQVIISLQQLVFKSFSAVLLAVCLTVYGFLPECEVH